MQKPDPVFSPPVPPVPDLLPMLIAGQNQLAGEFRALRQAIERGRAAHTAGRSLRPGDLKALDVLLPEIVRSIGIGVVFTIRDLFERAKSGDKQLRAALESVFGKTLDRSVARRAGDLFKRSAGFVHDGFRVERCATVREGALWIVRRE